MSTLTWAPNQVADFLNGVLPSFLGESALVNQDLSNIVDTGQTISDARNLKDPILQSLIARIGKEQYITAKFAESIPPVMRDSWQFGQILMKVRSELPRLARNNESWELQDGVSYDPTIYHKPVDIMIEAFAKNTTFELVWSVTNQQFYGAFTSAGAMSAFLAMLADGYVKQMQAEAGILIRTLYQEIIADTIYADYAGTSTSAKSGKRAINIFYLYKQTIDASTTLTASNCHLNTEYNKFAAYVIGATMRHMAAFSGNFNAKGFVTSTPISEQTLVLLDDYKAAIAPYMQADTFNQEVIKIPQSFGIDYWQSPGNGGFAWSAISAINAKNVDGNTVSQANIIGVLHSKDAIAVCCEKDDIEAFRNPAGKFTNYWNRRDARYIVDPYEDVVVFFNA